MSDLNKMENPNILSSVSKSKSVPSLLLSSSQKAYNNPKERIKIINEIINTKNSELKKIKQKLAEIKLKEKLIEKEKFESKESSLPFMKKQEIIEDNKIKNKLNMQNNSLNNKIKLLTEKLDKIESKLIYNPHQGFLSSIKAKLKEVLNQKEMLLLKINENNEEIQKINEKDIKNKYKYNKKVFLENLDNSNNDINNIINRKNKINQIMKNYLSENDIIKNSNKDYHKDLYEEEINKKKKEQKIKEEKYKEMREKEIKTVQKRKNLHINFEKEILSRNWINNFSNSKNYLSWDAKEKQRIKSEQDLILLSNNKRNILYKPLSSEELNNFSNKVKKEENKIKNNLEIKKKKLEEFWKERKDTLPKHKSKFLMNNILNDKKEKEDLLLKKEKIKGNMFERMNFSSEVRKIFRPKLIDEKIKKERIKKIMELDGKNKQREIRELNNKLKMKLIKIVNTQPKNFRKNNIFETSKSVFEQQTLKLRNYKNLELSNINNDKNNILTPKNIKSKSIKKSKEKSRNINNNFLSQINREKSYKQYVKNIQIKLRLLNQLIE